MIAGNIPYYIFLSKYPSSVWKKNGQKQLIKEIKSDQRKKKKK